MMIKAILINKQDGAYGARLADVNGRTCRMRP